MTREASLWPFLHGELDTAAKSELRQALDAQPELQQRLEACRRADRLLNAYFLSDAASSASSEDTLVERAMQAWDSERRRRARPHGWPGWGGVAGGWHWTWVATGMACVLGCVLALQFARLQTTHAVAR